MGHLMETVNPQALARINGEGRSLPSIGEMVLYHPRMSEMKRGRHVVPALVQAVDENNRRLELLVIYDRDDMMSLQGIAEHVEGDRGWSRLGTDHTDAIAELRTALDALTALIIADFQMPENQSVMGLIDAMDERVGKVEDYLLPLQAQSLPAAGVAPVTMKRRPGRPRRVV